MPKRDRGDAKPTGTPASKRPTPPSTSFYPLAVTVDGDAPWPPYVYIKRHIEQAGSGGGTAAPPRAAYVAGLPPMWRPPADVLAAVFRRVGDVDAVVVGTDATSAIVSFADAAALEAVMALAARGGALAADVPPPDGPFGLKAWVEDHKRQFPGNDVLQSKVRAKRGGDDGRRERARGEGRRVCSCFRPTSPTPTHLSPPVGRLGRRLRSRGRSPQSSRGGRRR